MCVLTPWSARFRRIFTPDTDAIGRAIGPASCGDEGQMTRPEPPSNVRCSVCGAVSRHQPPAPRATPRTRDLDWRPENTPHRHMTRWLQQCPDCGYCYSDISIDLGLTLAFVESSPYQSQRLNRDNPPLANAFLCRALVEEATVAYSRAAWSAIHAAWVCDDLDRVENAAACRLRALGLRKLGFERGQRLCRKDGVDLAIAVDLSRRAGLFGTATQLARELGDSSGCEDIRRILSFQMSLAAKRDAGRYSATDVECVNDPAGNGMDPHG